MASERLQDELEKLFPDDNGDTALKLVGKFRGREGGSFNRDEVRILRKAPILILRKERSNKFRYNVAKFALGWIYVPDKKRNPITIPFCTLAMNSCDNSILKRLIVLETWVLSISDKVRAFLSLIIKTAVEEIGNNAVIII